MATYLIGDIHGCYLELKNLLAQVQFNSACDTLWLTGDLVARGPHSLEVLRFVRDLGDSVRIVLGNHDLHLLAVYTGISCTKPNDRLNQLLQAIDIDELINWLRHQPLLQIDEEKQLIMTHAGITPQWDIITACQCAQEVEDMLASDHYQLFLNMMFDDRSNNWNNKLSRRAKLQFSINAFTRMRYCLSNGTLAIGCNTSPAQAANHLTPWFIFPSSVVNHYSIVFGHWASLSGYSTPANIYGLDTGCCWGDKLTLLSWEDKQIISVSAINYLHSIP